MKARVTSPRAAAVFARVLGCLAVLPLPAACRRLRRQHRADPRTTSALRNLELIYGERATEHETHAQALRAQVEMSRATGEPLAAYYGEIQPAAALEMFKRTGMQAGQRFYDLGSGFGKTVVLAWLLGINATGVELVEERWRASCELLRRAREKGVSGPRGGARFEQASFLDMDFSDADLVFVNSVMFSSKTLEDLAGVARGLRPGTRVVASHKGLPGPGFQQIGTLHGGVSWSDTDSTWAIQTVTGNSTKGVVKANRKTLGSAHVCRS